MAFTHVRVPWTAANGRIGSFGLDFEHPVGIGGTELQAIADAATTEWFTHVAKFTADTTLLACKAQGQERVLVDPGTPNEHPARQPTSTEFVGSPGSAAGTAAGDSAVPGVSMVVTLRTSGAGRRARGRVYTPPPPESAVSASGAVSDAAARVTMVREICEAVEGAIPGVDVDHVVWSITFNQHFDVITYNTNGFADYQRRRGRQLS